MLERKPTHEDVLGAYAGLRPLIDSGDGRSADLSRKHVVLTAGKLARTALKTPAYTTLVAIDPLWSTHKTISRNDDRFRPNPIRVSGITVLYSAW